MTKQPIWKLIANLGDVNLADYGGFLVYIDTTGKYCAEAEIYEPLDNDADNHTGGTRYRIPLENNPAPWWLDKLSAVADVCGHLVDRYLHDLASNDVILIAVVYRDLLAYFGPYEFDQYPVTMTYAEACERYKSIRTQSFSALKG